jgi:catechol 2,3-dioxygenase-like lactoylglutathione lyase family enzyme
MTEPTTRITHIATVIVPVADQDAALGFYRDTLGFEVRIDGGYGEGQRWIEVAPPGAQTSIALVPLGQSAGVEVSLATADAGTDHATLRASEVDADEELIRWEDVPPMFTFRDPDGNPFRVVERP